MKFSTLVFLIPFLANAALAQGAPQLCDDNFWDTASRAEIAEAIATEDANATCDLQMGPLHKAARFGTADDIAALVARGAYVGDVTMTVGTPLHVAAYGRNVETIAALIAAGADVNGQLAPNRSTPLHFAVEWGGTIAHMLALLEAGADFGLQDSGGFTPLNAAIELLMPEKAEALRAVGAIEN